VSKKRELFDAIEAEDLDKVKEILSKKNKLGAKFNPNYVLDHTTPLCLAARLNNIKIVEELYSSNADVNKLGGGISPLCHAVRNDNLEMVNFLLKKNANINQADRSGLTPLMIAITNRYDDIFERLIEWKPDLYKKNKDGKTALQLARKEFNIRYINRLENAQKGKYPKKNVSKPISKNQENIDNSNAESNLGIKFNNENDSADEKDSAAEIDDMPYYSEEVILKALKNRDMDILMEALNVLEVMNILNEFDSVKEKFGDMTINHFNMRGVLEIALISAADKNNVKTINGLCQRDFKGRQKVNPNCIASHNGWTPLECAASKGNTGAVEALLRNGGGMKMYSSLVYAAIHGWIDTIKILLKFGADVNEIDAKIAKTPLDVGVIEGHLELVILLLQHGANVNYANSLGWTPLMIASDQDKMDMIQILLRFGANIFLKNNENNTALMIAKESGHAKIAQLLDLIEKKIKQNRGASTRKPIDSRFDNAKLSEREKALFFAIQHDDVDTITTLCEKNADRESLVNPNCLDNNKFTPLQFAAYYGFEKSLERLLTLGADANNTIDRAAAPLFIAIGKGNIKALQILIKYGANVLHCDDNGTSVLHYAVENRLTYFIDILVMNGANVNHAKSDGVSPLFTAAENGDDEIIKILIDEKAKINQATNDGETPLYIAAQYGHVGAMEILLKKGALVNKATDEGESPLYVAVHEGRNDAVELLLSYEADINFKCNGKTALMIARDKGFSAIVRVLENFDNTIITSASIQPGF